MDYRGNTLLRLQKVCRLILFENLHIAADTRENSEKMRTLYNRFLKSVRDLIGDETSSEELHSACWHIFKTLTGKKSDTEKRFDIESPR